MAGSEDRPTVVVLGPQDLTDTPMAWPVLGTETLGEGVIVTLQQDQVETPDGEVIRREYLQHPGAVGVIAIDDQSRVALVRQYRHPVRHRLIEPPAGLLDVQGEDPLLAAQRELAEEVGLTAGRWNVLVELFTSPGILAEPMRIFLARDLSAGDAPEGFVRAGEEAHMDTVWAPLSDLADAVLAGRLHNPTLVAGVLAAWAAWQRDQFATLRPSDAPWPARDALLAAAGLAATDPD
jgi:8-oxo-dGTP pyrophosphatase MutT (NUDIX family)